MNKQASVPLFCLLRDENVKGTMGVYQATNSDYHEPSDY